jgi:hypothetical protein
MLQIRACTTHCMANKDADHLLMCIRRAFGPSAAAAQLEGSKAFLKVPCWMLAQILACPRVSLGGTPMASSCC